VAAPSVANCVIRANRHTRALEARHQTLVVIDDERRMSLGRRHEVRIHAKVENCIVTLIPAPTPRGQDRRLFERRKAEESHVEIVAAPLLASRNGELYMFKNHAIDPPKNHAQEEGSSVYKAMGSLIKKRRKRMRKKKHKKMLKRTRFQRRAAGK